MTPPLSEQLTTAGVFRYHGKTWVTNMSTRSVIRHDVNVLYKWFHKSLGTNRGTHWSIAGSVAVIISGSCVIYSNRSSNPAAAAAASVAQETRLR
jgi:hypothetical protein